MCMVQKLPRTVTVLEMQTALCVPSLVPEVLTALFIVGKFAIVTGASSGIGLETARQLVLGGARVVVTSPKLQRAEQCKQDIRSV